MNIASILRKKKEIPVVPVKLHTSCDTLLLADYIKCQIDNNLDALVIEGNPTEAEKLRAWTYITEQYYDLSADKQANYELKLCAEIESLNFKIVAIQEAVEIMRKYRNADLVDMLHKLGFRFPFNHKNEKEYEKDLQRVLSRAKTFVVEVNDRTAQLEKLNEGKAPGQTVTRAYYDNALATLSKFNSYEINENNITVSRYIAILNVYVAHCEHLNTQAHARR